MSAVGTLTLYVDTEPVGRRRDHDPARASSPWSATACASAATAPRPSRPDYARRSRSVGGTIDRVVIDVSGEHYVDHEKEVLAYVPRD